MPGSETKTYQAACFQFNVERGNVAGNLEAVLGGIRAAAAQGAELIVLPEMWTTSLVKDLDANLIRQADDAEQSVLRLTRELEIMVIGSSPEMHAGKYYNRARVVDNGHVLGAYRKIHMFSPNAEDRIMTPGDKPLVLDTRLGRIAVVLCYDLRFPELTRYYFHKGAQVMAVPAQWPEARADHWKILIRARAIENQCFVVGCNRTGSESSLRNDETYAFPGNSRIADPMGDILASAEGEDQPILAEIQLRRCRSMQRIIPIHEDRQPQTYREMWRPLWTNPDEPKTPTIPTIDEATPASKSGSDT